MAKILLIEDDSLIVKIYTTRLRADGYEVAYAEDGEKGLSVALQEKPDLILLDVMMPKVDGFNVLQSLRAVEQFHSIPIIVYSNLAQEAETKRALDLGATEFITKANISPTELVAKIKTYLKPGIQQTQQEQPAQTQASVQENIVEPAAATNAQTPPSVEQNTQQQSVPPADGTQSDHQV